MGTLMRRSSSAISFTRPGTPSKSSSESLKLDAKAQATLDHAMPSPVAESPAREAAESMPEPAGPSKLSGPPISVPRDSPEPSATASTSKSEQPPVDSAANSSVQPISTPALNMEQDSTVEVVPVTHPSTGMFPVSLAALTSTIPPESTPGTIDVAAADPTHDDPLTHSPKALSHTEVEHLTEQAQEEPLPVRRSEDSGSTQSHGQVIPPDERKLPTELLAAPWDNPLVTDRTPQPEQEVPTLPHAPLGTPEPTRVSTPPASVEAPSANVDNVTSVATTPRQNNPPAFDADKSSVAGVALKSRTRGSTVSSQVRPRTPSNPIARRPSTSSLASSAIVLSSHAPAVSTEPRQEEVAAPPPSNRPENPFDDPAESMRPADAPRPAENPGISMPEPVPFVASARDIQNTAPIDVPLPSVNQVVHERPIQTASAAGNGAIFSPRELEYDTDETRPLLPRSTTPFKNPPTYGHAEPTHSMSIFAPQNGDHMWPIPMRRFTNTGWQDIVLPDGSSYYSNSTLHVVTDIDLRNSERLDAVTTYLEGRDMDILPPQGWELWLRDAGASTTTFIPAKAWVHHGTRMLLFQRPSSDPGEVIPKDVDKSDMEYQYWSYMVSHPAHAPLPSTSVSEAIDVLTWSYTDRLLPSSHPSPPPFNQEECQQLITLLRSFNHVSAQTISVVRTRAVSKVLLRIAAWRQGRPLGDASHQDTRGNGNATQARIPFRRTAGDFVVSLFCLGLPYLFLERSHHQRFDAEGGVRNIAGPMLVVGGFACLIAAIILSASVTFITLPGLDDVSRISGFLAILLSAFSLISAVIALFRYKSDIEHPVAYPRGEGLVLLSRRSVLLSLPLVFLLYAIAAFITGIALYAFRGLTSVSGRPFGDFTQWVVICTFGGLACILFTSQLLIH